MADWIIESAKFRIVHEEQYAWNLKIFDYDSHQEISRLFGWQCKTFEEFGVSDPIINYGTTYHLQGTDGAIRIESTKYVVSFLVGYVHSYSGNTSDESLIALICNTESNECNFVSVSSRYVLGEMVGSIRIMLTSGGAKILSMYGHGFGPIIFDHIQDIETGAEHLAVIGGSRIAVYDNGSFTFGYNDAIVTTIKQQMSNGKCFTNLTRYFFRIGTKGYISNNIYMALMDGMNIDTIRTVAIDGQTFTRIQERTEDGDWLKKTYPILYALP